jgi:hypothetical protein
MTSVVVVDSKNRVYVDCKTHELVVSPRRVEVIVGNDPSTSTPKPINVSLHVEFVTLSAQNILDKKVAHTLPRVGALLFDVVAAPTQYEGADYVVVGNFVDWNSLGLDGILAEGDVVRFAYLVEA